MLRSSASIFARPQRATPHRGLRYRCSHSASAPSRPLLQELHERGFVQDVTDRKGLDRLLRESASAKVSVYAGFDPTAPSLHAGNLLLIMMLKHFERAGLRPIALVGGATGQIGDPSGKAQERELMAQEKLTGNLNLIAENLRKFFPPGSESGALVVDNLDWFRHENVLSFMRRIGKHFRVAGMLAKEAVKTRVHASGLSFLEFSYQIFQAYDFVHLFTTHNCRVQIGGSDQWGNICAGLELIGRLHATSESSEEAESANKCGAFGVTIPLLTTADGQKVGKSAGNAAVWLDAKMTSPFDFYQYFFRTTDSDVARFLRLFTFLSLEEIAAIEAEHRQDTEKHFAQRRLAEEVTRFVHGEAKLSEAVASTQFLYAKKAEAFTSVEQIPEGVPRVELPRAQVEGQTVVTLAASAKLCSSKSEARRLVSEGGFYLNNQRLSPAELHRTVTASDIVQGKYVLLRTGQRKYLLITIV